MADEQSSHQQAEVRMVVVDMRAFDLADAERSLLKNGLAKWPLKFLYGWGQDEKIERLGFLEFGLEINQRLWVNVFYPRFKDDNLFEVGSNSAGLDFACVWARTDIKDNILWRDSHFICGAVVEVLQIHQQSEGIGQADQRCLLFVFKPAAD